MGVTTNNGIPFPEYTDPPDGPKQIGAVANWLEGWIAKGGADWVSWTPTVTQGAGVTVTNNRSRWMKYGRLVIAKFKVTVGSSGTSGQPVTISAPEVSADAEDLGGMGFVNDVSANLNYVGMIYPSTTSSFIIAPHGVSGAIGVTPAFALASGDIIRGHLIQEDA